MPIFFETPAAFRAWLEAHGATASEVIVGFHTRKSGRPSLTWPESVDEALCFGWIDGVRKNLDEDSYQIRFTPRKATSIWSAVNLERVRVLQAEGRMTKAGLEAHARRRETASKVYSYEQAEEASLDPQEDVLFRKHEAAWRFFQAQPPGYRRRALWWIVSAKRPETRRSRLGKLIAASEEGRRL
ncbi:YdeI family protein [Geothrix sp. 21YS21S-4]|uniref:YdeI/OmpD-associated family protein n=1 Tax=Geothrix sp. 21YS21S-4 TaxID=3068889 RepID=UPI0027B9F54A|nr:YdeI/OmpD-associated family protein [Geothrix sp. 21YS21S-4]